MSNALRQTIEEIVGRHLTGFERTPTMGRYLVAQQTAAEIAEAIATKGAEEPQGTLLITEMPEKPAVKVTAILDGGPGVWIAFDTHDTAWGLVESLTKHVEAMFGPP